MHTEGFDTRRRGFAARCEAGLCPAGRYMNISRGYAPGSGSALTPTSTAPPVNEIVIHLKWLTLKGLLRQMRARTGGTAPFNSFFPFGRAEPCLTSGGEAVARALNILTSLLSPRAAKPRCIDSSFERE